MFTIPTWLIVILAIAAAVCMGISYKKKDDPKFKPLAIVAVLILIVCAYAFIDNEIGIGRDNLKTRQAKESAERFNEARIKFLGEHIKSKNPGKIVIVPSGGTNYAKVESAKNQAELVKKYVGSADIKPVDYTRSEEEMAANPQPTVEEFNKFFKANADAKLFIILEPLPMSKDDLVKLEIFAAANKQQIALLDIGDTESIKPLIKSGKVLVAIAGKPDLKAADYEKPAPKDLKKAFDSRYILVTKENVDSIK